jgi:periplasmic divalent cation tolerance protein
MTDKIVVLNTCGSADEAERLARKLVDERLAACVTVVMPVRSYYRWEGEVQDAAEWLLIIKTSRGLVPKLRQSLESVHSYQVPELIALPIVEGSPNYLAWMTGELQTPDSTDIE